MSKRKTQYKKLECGCGRTVKVDEKTEKVLCWECTNNRRHQEQQDEQVL